MTPGRLRRGAPGRARAAAARARPATRSTLVAAQCGFGTAETHAPRLRPPPRRRPADYRARFRRRRHQPTSTRRRPPWRSPSRSTTASPPSTRSGPTRCCQRLPGAEVTFVAAEPGPIRTDIGHPRAGRRRHFDDVRAPDIVVVPGGSATATLLERRAAARLAPRRRTRPRTWTTSVCTGSLLLGARPACSTACGRRPTGARSTCSRRSARYPTTERVVERGKIVTAAGVSSGIDMALTLAGTDRRRRGRPGDPARHRVRPAAAVRRGFAAQGPARGRRAGHRRLRGAGVCRRDRLSRGTRAARPGRDRPYDSAVNPPAPTALIMAAGEGTRMHSAVPKVLHEVCGRPMIAWPILAARDAGAGRICVIVSPDGDLSSVLPEGTETVVQPDAEEPEAPCARPPESSATPERFLVLSGDTPLLGADAIEGLLAAHEEAGAAATTMTTELDDPGTFGRVIRSPDGDVDGLSRRKSPATPPPSSSGSGRSTPAPTRSLPGRWRRPSTGSPTTTPRASTTCPTSCP